MREITLFKKIFLMTILTIGTLSYGENSKNGCYYYEKESERYEVLALKNVKVNGASNPVTRSGTYATLALLYYNKFTHCLDKYEMKLERERKIQKLKDIKDQ